MTARERLMRLAKEIEQAAIDAHADGLVLAKVSARFVMVANVCNEEQCATCIARAGEAMPPGYEIFAELAQEPDTNAPGGDS